MTVRFFSIFAAAVLVTSAASAQSAGPAPADAPAAAPVNSAAATAVDPAVGDTSKDYRIGSEDVLEVWIYDQQSLGRRVPVRPDGKISLPFVNDIVAQGRTANELRDIITERLKKFIATPEVSVMVMDVKSRKVSVNGDVRMPGQFDMSVNSTVLEMLSRAQGFTDYANRKDIRILRKGKVVKFNYDRVQNGDDPDIAVEPGDIILVTR